MRVIRGGSPLEKAQGCVIALGNFDGLHKGHQEIFRETIRLAKAGHTRAAALTFEPHPVMFFKPELQYFRLTPFRAKMQYMQKAGLDYVFILPFNQTTASLSPSDFVSHILADRLKPKRLVIGHEFNFGKARAGNAELLAALGQQHGIKVTQLSGIEEHGSICSSTRIRDLLQSGDINTATQLLGHEYFIEGRVIQGDGRGKLLRYPTANISLHQQLLPKFGVYKVTAEIDHTLFPAIANLGIRPSFNKSQPALEVHVFDFEKDIYGQRLKVIFHDFIREEQKFDSVSALISQIEKDCAIARSS